MNIRDFLAIELSDRKNIKLKLAYIDIAEGDIEAGLLLSQIAYWHEPSKETGKSKLRVFKEDNFWIAKGRDDWYKEIRLNAKRFDKASKILVKNGLIEKKIFKFAGDPVVHVRIIWENFLPAYEKQINEYLKQNEEENEGEPYSPLVIPKTGKTNLPKREKGTSPNGKKDLPKTGISLTEITTEITTESTLNIEKENIIISVLDFYEIFNKADKDYIVSHFQHYSLEAKKHVLIKQASLMALMIKRGEPIYSKGVYFVTGYEALLEAEISHGIEKDKRKIKNESEPDTKIPFYNWLEQ